MKQTGPGILLILALTGCDSNDISESIEMQVGTTQAVHLRTAAPGDWDRICVLGPYSSDQAVRDALGFNWPAQSRSSIGESDGISLLLFIREQEVVYSVEHPRDKGDFSQLSGRCFSPEQAQFVRRAGRADDWPDLVPRNGA